MDPQSIIMWVMVAVIFVLLVVWWVFSGKKRKKQEQESKDLINSVKPGNKVKTIGGICGIVVEVDNEENTFVLETGSVTAGKSYVKLDKQAIWQTDAVVDKKDNKSPEKPEESTPAGDAEQEESPAAQAGEEKPQETEAAQEPNPEAGEAQAETTENQ